MKKPAQRPLASWLPDERSPYLAYPANACSFAAGCCASMVGILALDLGKFKRLAAQQPGNAFVRRLLSAYDTGPRPLVKQLAKVLIAFGSHPRNPRPAGCEERASTLFGGLGRRRLIGEGSGQRMGRIGDDLGHRAAGGTSRSAFGTASLNRAATTGLNCWTLRGAAGRCNPWSLTSDSWPTGRGVRTWSAVRAPDPGE